ncbi:PocR ligand-binding domain-containing protein [Desulfovibrio gilichinskyi]|uniref:histidine kinase n=1 Tax=Desulfovibrio gilichinskyi TaxID=1519643 RepID=A0A1X7DJF2_9BACT|nr:PocR ligand-binding domain-containing protein [Desulfovibrio gilichinskyi]SMF16760.1 PAS domain S-box-containing protein [Desulfovibrio gilichinskyi]
MSNDDNEKSKLLSEFNTLRIASHCMPELPSDNPFSGMSEDGFSCLLNAIPGLVWIKDPDGVYLSCNDAFESFWGLPKKDIVGKTYYDFAAKEVADFSRMQDKMAMADGCPSVTEERLTSAGTSKSKFVEIIRSTIKSSSGNLIGVLGIARDITDRKKGEDLLEKRITALTSPLDSPDGIVFEDLFDLKDIQRLQNEFSDATGVASLITRPDGSPITQTSNFCKLCEIIRKTKKGLANCYRSDAMLGLLKSDGPTIRKCMSGGLWDAGAGISVGGHHVANWLIGQVRDAGQDEVNMRAYARDIGADEDDVAAAFAKSSAMSHEQFSKVSNVLFTLATQLSDIAYKNIQQARFINDLKKTKAELAKTRNYLSNIIDSMPSLLIGVDTNCQVTQWNIEAAKVTSLSAQEALGQSLGKVLPRIAFEMARVDEAIRTRTPCSDSLRTNTPGGDVIHENITIYPLVANGVDGAVVRIDDVTNLVKLQQMMVQSEKMLSIGGLAAGIAHEINNPLASILGYVLNIQRRIFGDIPKNETVASECGVSLEDIRKYLEHRDIPRMLEGIHESGLRAGAIVHNMLSFSRKSEKELKPHDIIELLDTTLDLAANDYNLEKKYDFRNIEIVREYDEHVPAVYCEKSEMQQVFLNLFRNGAEAMMGKVYENGHPRFICRVKQRGDAVLVEIEDNGTGVDDAVRKRIFEPFYTTKDVGQGTGLGLSVSYFIITDLHHGRLEVDSVLGEWTRFTIKLSL